MGQYGEASQSDSHRCYGRSCVCQCVRLHVYSGCRVCVCVCVCVCLLPLILFASGPNLLKTSVCWGQVFAVWGVFVQLNNYPDCFAWSPSWRRCCSGHWRPSRTSANQSDREVRTGSRNWGNSQTLGHTIVPLHTYSSFFENCSISFWPLALLWVFIYTRKYLHT